MPLDPEPFLFRNDGEIPNHPTLPALIYRQAVTAPHKESYFQFTFESNGWGGVWKNGIFDYHHFHSNAHEALGIASGQARVQLGGKHGLTFEVEEGDMLILPAGTGHICPDSSSDFVVIGAYPAGQEAYDICRSLSEDHTIPERIEAVPLPTADPLFGEDGPLLRIWRK
jgi:uncharacterized protein YjlB